MYTSINIIECNGKIIGAAFEIMVPWEYGAVYRDYEEEYSALYKSK